MREHLLPDCHISAVGVEEREAAAEGCSRHGKWLGDLTWTMPASGRMRLKVEIEIRNQSRQVFVHLRWHGCLADALPHDAGGW